MGSSPRENPYNRSTDIGISAENTRQDSARGNSSILNSWKEIAQYLGRGVRTVQRWERNFGLPVHRPKGQDRSATVALTSELDEWLRQTPVRSRPNGHAENGPAQDTAGDGHQRVSVIQAGPNLTKNENGCRYLILSVDDEPGVLYTREKILESEGYDVLSAPDGEKALEFLRAHTVHLVLLDYKMPGMNGGTVAREIKRRAPKLPIVMISGNNVPGEALALVNSFLPKGEGPALLFATIRQLLTPTIASTKPQQVQIIKPQFVPAARVERLSIRQKSRRIG